MMTLFYFLVIFLVLGVFLYLTKCDECNSRAGYTCRAHRGVKHTGGREVI